MRCRSCTCHTWQLSSLPGDRPLCEGCRESRRCSRNIYPKSCITKYTSIRRENWAEMWHLPHLATSMCFHLPGEIWQRARSIPIKTFKKYFFRSIASTSNRIFFKNDLSASVHRKWPSFSGVSALKVFDVGLDYAQAEPGRDPQKLTDQCRESGRICLLKGDGCIS